MKLITLIMFTAVAGCGVPVDTNSLEGELNDVEKEFDETRILIEELLETKDEIRILEQELKQTNQELDDLRQTIDNLNPAPVVR